jgi:hypothetical protein
MHSGQFVKLSKLYIVLILMIACLTASTLAGQVPTTLQAPADLPAVFTWGNYNGTNWMTSTHHIGSCGSGTCGTTIADVFDTRYRILAGDPAASVHLSEQYLISCYVGNCGGCAVYTMMANFKNSGCPDSACFPYNGSETSPACTSRCSDWASRLYHISAHSMVAANVTAIKTEIMTHGPVITYLDVYSDFATYSSGVYFHQSTYSLGAMWVVLYGWNDTDTCWYGKNAWGTYFGELGPDGKRGWFRIKMGRNECQCEAYVYTLTPILRSCCVDLTGNVDCDLASGVDISDLSAMIDNLYISFAPLCCKKEANVDGSLDGNIDISDLSALIDYLYISFTPPAACQ